MHVSWRLGLAVLIAVAPPAAIGLWPAPVTAAHADAHADHTAGEHAPESVATHQSHLHTKIPAGVGAGSWNHTLPEWPGGGRTLEVGQGSPYRTLSDALAAAADGDHIIIDGGWHSGNFRVEHRVWIEGRAGATISGGGKDSVITAVAPGTRITGLVIRDSGSSVGSEDAGILLDGAAGGFVAGCSLQNVEYGIQAKQSPGTVIVGNTVIGQARSLDLNGDGIRTWSSDGVQIEANTVIATREIVLEQSPGARVRANAVTDGRVGIHLMKADRAEVTGNFLSGNSTGIYVMYDSGQRIEGNWIENNRGSSGYGVAVKEADQVQIRGNWVFGNRVGLNLDNTPFDQTRPAQFTGNLVAYNDEGASLTPSSSGNLLTGNDFLENLRQVSSPGGGALGQNTWTAGGRGNYWSDYAGYDAAGDGVGDLPYAPVRLFERWMDRQPQLKWFWSTPASATVDLAARAFPVAAPDPLLVDEKPAMAPMARRDSPWSNLTR